MSKRNNNPSETSLTPSHFPEIPETHKALILTKCQPDVEDSQAIWYRIAPTQRQLLYRFIHALLAGIALVVIAFFLAGGDIINKMLNDPGIQTGNYLGFIVLLFFAVIGIIALFALFNAWMRTTVVFVNPNSRQIVLSRFFQAKKAISLTDLALYFGNKSFCMVRFGIEADIHGERRNILETFAESGEIESVFRWLQALSTKNVL